MVAPGCGRGARWVYRGQHNPLSYPVAFFSGWSVASLRTASHFWSVWWGCVRCGPFRLMHLDVVAVALAVWVAPPELMLWVLLPGYV